MNNLRDRLKNMKVPDINDPEGCPLCGAIAGVCDNYPECKKDWPIDNLRDQIEQAASLWEIQIRNSAHVKLKKQLTPKQFADQIIALIKKDHYIVDKSCYNLLVTCYNLLVTAMNEMQRDGIYEPPKEEE